MKQSRLTFPSHIKAYSSKFALETLLRFRRPKNLTNRSSLQKFHPSLFSATISPTSNALFVRILKPSHSCTHFPLNYPLEEMSWEIRNLEKTLMDRAFLSVSTDLVRCRECFKKKKKNNAKVILWKSLVTFSDNKIKLPLRS